jgi:hypothetical protein
VTVLTIRILIQKLHISPTQCLYVFGVMFNLLIPTGHVMHQQFNIQQLYVLPPHSVLVHYSHCIPAKDTPVPNEEETAFVFTCFVFI